MSTITVKDGTTIYYKDWGKGPVVTFSHGWPLDSDAWDDQMLFLAESGFRVVAHDRRGHGRSSQAWSGNDMNGYADDLAADESIAKHGRKPICLDLMFGPDVGHPGERSFRAENTRAVYCLSSGKSRTAWSAASSPTALLPYALITKLR